MNLQEELEKIVKKEEETIEKYDFAGGADYKRLVRELRELLNKDEHPAVTKTDKNLPTVDEQERFRKLVKCMVEQWKKSKSPTHDRALTHNLIRQFEDKIEEAGGEVFFSIVPDALLLHFIEPYPSSDYKFHAEYYDGVRAEWIVCEWNDDLEKLEELLKETSDVLYEEYQKYL